MTPPLSLRGLHHPVRSLSDALADLDEEAEHASDAAAICEALGNLRMRDWWDEEERRLRARRRMLQECRGEG